MQPAARVALRSSGAARTPAPGRKRRAALDQSRGDPPLRAETATGYEAGRPPPTSVRGASLRVLRCPVLPARNLARGGGGKEARGVPETSGRTALKEIRPTWNLFRPAFAYLLLWCFLNNSIQGIIHHRKTKARFVLIPDAMACAIESGDAPICPGAPERLRAIPSIAPQGSTDLIRTSLSLSCSRFCRIALALEQDYIRPAEIWQTFEFECSKTRAGPDITSASWPRRASASLARRPRPPRSWR